MQNVRNITQHRRGGFTLVELILAIGLLSVIGTATVGLVRQSSEDFLLGSQRSHLLQEGRSALSKMILTLRQASEFTSVSGPSDNTGGVVFVDTDSVSRSFALDSGSGELRYGVTGNLSALSDSVTALTFTSYDVNGTPLSHPVTATDIRVMQIEMTVTDAVDSSISFDLATCVYWPLVTTGGTDLSPGVAVSDYIYVKDDSRIDPVIGTAVVATNSSSNNTIRVRNDGVVDGDVYVGVGGSTSHGIKIQHSGQITGSLGVLTEAVDIPSPSAPSLGANMGNLSYSSGTTNISSDLHCNDLNINGTAIITISGDVTIYVDDDFNMADWGQLQLLSGATLTLYVEDDFELHNNAKLNVNTNDPSRLILNVLGTNDADLYDDSQMMATMTAYSVELNLRENSRMTGTFYGRALQMSTTAEFHVSER